MYGTWYNYEQIKNDVIWVLPPRRAFAWGFMYLRVNSYETVSEWGQYPKRDPSVEAQQTT